MNMFTGTAGTHELWISDGYQQLSTTGAVVSHQDNFFVQKRPNFLSKNVIDRKCVKSRKKTQ